MFLGAFTEATEVYATGVTCLTIGVLYNTVPAGVEILLLREERVRGFAEVGLHRQGVMSLCKKVCKSSEERSDKT